METNCNFPDDLVSEILSWLSVIQLLVFRCVSKSWCAIIDHPTFIRKHHGRQYAILKHQAHIPIFSDSMSLTGGLFILELSSLEDAGTQLYFLSKRFGDLHLLELKGFIDSTPHKNLIGFAQFACMGCANGVVLFEWCIVSGYFGLWNPATRQFKVVHRSCRGGMSTLGFREHMHGMSTLGFDPNSTDIKIISQIYRLRNETKIYYGYEMYSLKTNSWKSMEYPSHPEHDLSAGPDLDPGVSINNIHYWTYTNVTRSPYYIPRSHVPEREKCSFILSVDFCSEVFEFLSQPHIEGKYKCSLGNFNGSLAFICYQETSVPVKIWVMTKVDDHGIPSGWQHLFSIEPFQAEYVSYCTFRVGGDMFLTLSRYPNPNRRSIHWDDDDDHEYGCLYDPATKRIIVRFEFGFYHGCFEYVESLLKLKDRI